MDQQGLRRLDRRLASITAEQLAWACRDRAHPKRYRGSESFLGELAARVRSTGASAVDPGRDMLPPSLDSIDGYVTSSEAEAIVRDFMLVPDPAGNVTLRVTDHRAVESWSGRMPAGVVGIDLLESSEPRELSAGRRLVTALMP